MAYENNPVGRLLVLLEKARGQSHGSPARVVWGTTLDLPPADTPRILYAFYEVTELIQEAKHAVEALPDVDKTLYLEPFQTLEPAFKTLNLDHPFTPVYNALTDRVMLGLRFAAEAVSRNAPEEAIPAELLAELQAEVAALLEEVLAAELDVELRSFLLDSLSAMQQAILDFRIRGAKGMREAVNQAVGAALRHAPAIQEEKDNPLVGRVFDFLGRFNDLAEAGRNAWPLLAPIVGYLLGQTQHLLPPGGP